MGVTRPMFGQSGRALKHFRKLGDIRPKYWVSPVRSSDKAGRALKHFRKLGDIRPKYWVSPVRSSDKADRV
jgi:hypothetical protein